MGVLLGQVIPYKLADRIGQGMPVSVVYASGTTEITISSAANTTKTMQNTVSNSWWSSLVGSANCTDITASSQVIGWQCSSEDNKYGYNFRNIYGWDLDALPDGAEVVSMKVELWLKHWDNGYGTPPNPYFGLYKTSAHIPVVLEDYSSAYIDYSKRNLMDYVRHSEVAEAYEWVTFNVLESRIEEFLATEDDNGIVWLTAASMNDMTTNAPLWENGAISRLEGDYTMGKLTISYLEDTPERIIVTKGNAAVDNTTDGTETADNITWSSPRLGYSDEGICLWVNGESGAVVDLELVDGAGNVLESVTDSVRVDGVYEFTADLPDNWYGYVRLHELNNSIYSVWGYQYPVPDADQVGNTVYAVNTEHPQYDFLFTRYIKGVNEIMAIHWKTNVQSDELDSHSFQMWTNGDNVTPAYNQTLEWLNDNYFMASDNNSFLAGWRYLLMTPDVVGAGFEDYDGLFINMDSMYSVVTAGFLQAAITTDNGSSLADSHSCYWYLAGESDGLIMITDKSDYASGEELIVKVQVGAVCKVSVNLPGLVLNILDSTGAVVNTAYVTVQDGLNEIHWEAPVIPGSYEMRFTFSGDGSWAYIHDRPFTVERGEDLESGGQIIDSIENWIAGVGLDNPAGYWLITLIGMVILFLLAYKSPVIRVALPLVFLGGMIIWEFIEMWLIVLLALGAGLSIFGILRKKTHGGGEE